MEPSRIVAGNSLGDTALVGGEVAVRHSTLATPLMNAIERYRLRIESNKKGKERRRVI